MASLRDPSVRNRLFKVADAVFKIEVAPVPQWNSAEVSVHILENNVAPERLAEIKLRQGLRFPVECFGERHNRK
jgi:hypothetical protein